MPYIRDFMVVFTIVYSIEWATDNTPNLKMDMGGCKTDIKQKKICKRNIIFHQS